MSSLLTVFVCPPDFNYISLNVVAAFYFARCCAVWRCVVACGTLRILWIVLVALVSPEFMKFN